MKHAQFVNFWPKSVRNPNHNSDPNPNPNPSQIAKRILQIACNKYAAYSIGSQVLTE